MKMDRGSKDSQSKKKKKGVIIRKIKIKKGKKSSEQ